jgi:hypothetical protein
LKCYSAFRNVSFYKLMLLSSCQKNSDLPSESYETCAMSALRGMVCFKACLLLIMIDLQVEALKQDNAVLTRNISCLFKVFYQTLTFYMFDVELCKAVL